MKIKTLFALALTGVVTGFFTFGFHRSTQSTPSQQPAVSAPVLSGIASLGQAKLKSNSETLDAELNTQTVLGRFQAILAGLPISNSVQESADNPVSLSQAEQQTFAKHSSLSPLLAQVEDLGPADLNLPLNITVALQPRNQSSLDAFLADVSNPDSANFQHFLTQAEFNETYAPTEEQEQKVVDWLTANGFQVSQRFQNRLVIGATGNHAAAVQAFGTSIHNVNHQNQTKFAAVQEPAFPAEISGLITGIGGLDNLAEMKPKAVAMAANTMSPNAALGANCCHFAPQDVKTFYADSTLLYDNSHKVLNGSGQTVIIAGAYAWNNHDINGFNKYWSLPAFNAVNSQQVCVGASDSAGCQFNYPNSIEVTLDAEYLHAIAADAVVKNYMAATSSLSSFSLMYNQIVLDNPGHIVTTSWGACEAEIPRALQILNDAIIANGNAIGQSWFAASGDNGADACGNGSTSVDHPANSPHVVSVGGTTPTCNSGMADGDASCGGYGSESAWSGSGGGSSTVFTKPGFQSGCGMAATSKNRLVPDISLAADPNHYGYYVAFNGYWYLVGGTSAAAPQWAGYFAQLNQYKPGNGQGLGLPGVRLYTLCASNAFHDIISGSNGVYASGKLYDMVTGIGSIDAVNFLSNY